MNTQTRRFFGSFAWVLGLAIGGALAPQASAQTALADQPVFSSKDVPGNLALALSVEFPTAVSVAHIDGTYNGTKTYLGYFDPNKCYLYNYDADETKRHFYPQGAATSRACTASGDTAKWSGNFLNWATMQTIDPFRWALTGGYRSTDTATTTIIEKANATGQGGTGNFPNRTSTDSGVIEDNTPFSWSRFRMRIQGLGNKMRFTRDGSVDSAPTAYDPAVAIDKDTVYEVSVRVKVCDTSTGAGPIESNCTAYPAGNYKPTGLLQQYANLFRYSAFGYLNDDNIRRDGGVLRAKQKFVGTTQPVPTSTPIANPAAEWDADTGVLYLNPDSADATMTNTVFSLPTGTVQNSGVINYLNKFGQLPGATSFKTYDPVSELYYAALRYYKNLGNVSEWTDMTAATEATRIRWADGFPVITTWDDPVQYSCQRNFILGIGDVNTHADKNVPGSGMGSANEPTRPTTALGLDPVDAVAATNKIGSLHGLGSSLGTTENVGGCCNNNSALMAGLAYDANTKDIRPTVTGKPQTVGMQTVQTYWLDILEYSTYKSNNQYYLAAKYGGFKVPSDFGDPYARTTDLPTSSWTTSGETVGGQARPDNYFVAGDPAAMVAGLARAFSKAASDLKLYSTSFATALPQLAVSGSASYAAKYDAGSWTGEIEANSLTFDSSYNPVQTTQWSFSTKLAAQIAGTGWDTARRMVTWNAGGVPFRWASLSSAQQATLDTVYRSGSDGSDFLDYIRGNNRFEEGSSSTAALADKVYRARVSPVGDIVGSRVLPVSNPVQPFSDSTNPGYSTFKTTWASRPTMLYVGTNAGLMHAINGSLTGTDAGKEVFAYVPAAMFAGATGVPGATGLQARGDPDFIHKNMVDGPLAVFDIDLGRTVGGGGTTNWRSVLVGSLGKGGKGYYAIDVTDPASMTTEAIVAGKVLWEINQSQPDYADLGFTYGQPVAVKTRKYGWVIIFASGHNNSNGNGYFFVVNPRTGALLEKVAVPVTGTTSSPLGMAHLEAYVLDFTDGTADSAYAGDLKGNVFRLDLTPLSAAYTVTHLAQIKNSAGDALPITTRPALILHPRLNKRFVALGTGRLLNNTDISDSRAQVFVSITDGNGAGFNTPYDSATPTKPNMLPSTVTFPIQMSKLKQHTDLTLPVAIDPRTQMGWWVDLGLSAGSNSWRVVRDPSTFNGMVTFIATLPTPDACNPSGVSRLYSVDAGTGRSELVLRTTTAGVVTTTRVAYNDSLSGESISSQSVSVAGKRALIRCSNNGGCDSPATENPTPPGLRRLNWRELPLAD